ncbi:sigma factor-like helix-turn-helix DNA-binding protein [Pseudarthrobacter oxydans]|uniref:sigma factor-like helix-turn-helix DNA-binding protein n=1 Tax=Pseudarthrobacter oxydans TaxID=1671 RepID=UPI0027D7F315|nr:sigma factor-like helix-turn-helix DNA-binding protein [Pseudarthrobacter oxydans]
MYRRFFCEESQAELGRRFGVSQIQISRRLARVLMCLQQRLLEAEGHKSRSSRMGLPAVQSRDGQQRRIRVGGNGVAPAQPAFVSTICGPGGLTPISLDFNHSHRTEEPRAVTVRRTILRILIKS